MNTIKYTVKAHIIHVMYLNNTRLHTATDFIDVWSRLNIFGNQTADCGFWTASDISMLHDGGKKCQLGAVDLLNGLRIINNEAIYGTADFYKKNYSRDPSLDCDLYFCIKDASRWQGLDTRPSYTLAVSKQWIERIGIDAVLDLYKMNIATFDHYMPPYGLIDIADPIDAWAGAVYGSIGIMRAPLQRWIEQRNWVASASPKGDRVRGIYWGNYFGPVILNKLGGREQFIIRYRNYTTRPSGEPTAVIWEYPNGVFVSLCTNPLDCLPGSTLSMDTIFNLEWLQNELGRHGILNYW